MTLMLLESLALLLLLPLEAEIDGAGSAGNTALGEVAEGEMAFGEMAANGSCGEFLPLKLPRLTLGEILPFGSSVNRPLRRPECAPEEDVAEGIGSDGGGCVGAIAVCWCIVDWFPGTAGEVPFDPPGEPTGDPLGLAPASLGSTVDRSLGAPLPEPLLRRWWIEVR